MHSSYRPITWKHRRIQDFVRGGKALLPPPRGGAKALLAPLDPRLTIWGSNILWGGGGGKAPLPPPLDPRLWKITINYGKHISAGLRGTAGTATEHANYKLTGISTDAEGVVVVSGTTDMYPRHICIHKCSWNYKSNI